MAQHPMTIGFLIFPGFPMACLTSIIEPLRAANEISETKAFEWQLIAEDTGPVHASAGIAFDPMMTLNDVSRIDHLILLSPPSPSFQRKASLGAIRCLARHGTHLGAVSGGVFPLVASGAVLNETVSVHWCYAAAFTAMFPDHSSSDQVLQVGPKATTASGAAAAFDLALRLIEMRLGANIAAEVACWFQHPMMRKTDVRQVVPPNDLNDKGAPLPDHVARAIALFAEDIANPLQVAEIAEALNLTPRHIERSFKQATGQSPTHYFRQMRMNAARQIVMYTNDRLSGIASDVGYQSTQTFNKHYVGAFDVSPAEDRKRINLYRVKGNSPVPSV
ncbi:MAG: GlxA family transcriptional regulator [Planktomarina sp.]